ncbi:sensor histidine kinase [Actinomadura sp. 6N118]|uniref:sensor histidine kinase n=1 Tax=Actinomadura sp. 6N118 TaxID=3375151 RepID=UPI00379888AC
MNDSGPRHTRVKDALLFAVLALPLVYGVLLPPTQGGAGWWATAAGVAALGGAVAASRTWPLLSLVIVLVLVPVQGNFAFGVPVMAYLTGRRTAHARPVLWTFTAVFVAGSVLNIVRGIDVTSWFPLTLYLVLLGVLPWLVGRYWRQYQELVDAGWERAGQLEREQRIVAERERLRERARIAQDMHDSLGHELALIAVRAGALQVAPDLPERHRGQAAELRASAADATEHLREIIGVLREETAHDIAGRNSVGRPGEQDAADGTPAGKNAAEAPDGAPIRPARESITDLVERARTSGIPVHLTGDAAPPAGAAPMVALAAHRVVQEALTNAAKHAPGAAVTVRLARSDGAKDARKGTGATTVTVTNAPPPAGPPLLPSGGRGLTGLAERVRLAGGTLHTGPTADGGFRVEAELPDVPAVAPVPDAEHETAWRLDRGRRQVRRGLITAIAVPAGLVTVLSAIILGYYAYATLNSVLPPAEYEALRVGQPRAQVDKVLPATELINSDVGRTEFPKPPPGAHCEYYRADGNLLGIGTVYRLCFAGDRLASKHAVRVTSDPAPSPSGTP